MHAVFHSPEPIEIPRESLQVMRKWSNQSKKLAVCSKSRRIGTPLVGTLGLGAGSTGWHLRDLPLSSQRHHPPQTRKQVYFFGYSANHYFDTAPLSAITLLLKNP